MFSNTIDWHFLRVFRKTCGLNRTPTARSISQDQNDQDRHCRYNNREKIVINSRKEINLMKHIKRKMLITINLQTQYAN